jgi:hypothetical protein
MDFRSILDHSLSFQIPEKSFNAILYIITVSIHSTRS